VAEGLVRDEYADRAWRRPVDCGRIGVRIVTSDPDDLQRLDPVAPSIRV
jgi:hypothetical protein